MPAQSVVRRRFAASGVRLGAGVALLAAGLAAGASAQETRPSQASDRWTAVSLTGGLSSGSADTGGAVGLSLSRDLSDRLTFEAAGAYLDRGAGAEAVSADLRLLVNLTRPERQVVPYLSAGGGVYHASFDMGHGRFLGAVPAQVGSGATLQMHTGPNFGYWMGQGGGMMGSWTTYRSPGSGYGAMPWGRMPAFYGQRLGNMQVPADGRWGMRSFTDPAVSLGGGARIELTRRLVLRPEARWLMAIGGGDTYSVGLFTVNLGYRF